MEVSVKYLPIIVVCLFILVMSIKLHLALTTCNDHYEIYCFPCSNKTYTNQTHRNETNTKEANRNKLLQELCFLGQAGNFLWVLGSLVFYVKYRQVIDICNRYDMVKKKVFNRTTFQVGLIASLGISILANFQEINLPYIHWVGVFLFFGLSSIYQCLQTFLYLSISKIIGLKELIPLRIVLSALSVISFVIFFISAMMRNLMPYEYGCKLNILTLVFEWICALSTMVYLALFYWEFIKITLYEPDFFVIEKFTSTVNMQKTNAAFEDDSK